MAHQLPPLPYDYSALEPTIDIQMVRLHHDMRQATYGNNLNATLEKHRELFKKSADELLRDLSSIPEDIRTTVRNYGGGCYVSHTMFWKIMKPKSGGEPKGKIADAIRDTFGTFDVFKQQFNDARARQFGSGWVWLAEDKLRLRGAPPTRVVSLPDEPGATARSGRCAMTDLNGQEAGNGGYSQERLSASDLPLLSAQTIRSDR